MKRISILQVLLTTAIVSSANMSAINCRAQTISTFKIETTKPIAKIPASLWGYFLKTSTLEQTVGSMQSWSKTAL